MDEEEQFNQAFGEHVNISERCRADINRIKNNDPVNTNFAMNSIDASRFTEQAWRLLGRYIANNTHLEDVDLVLCGITDEIMSSLFGELTSSTSLVVLNLCGNNNIGIDSVRSMIPFLQNSPKISDLRFAGSNNINTECFELLISTLHERPLAIKSLNSLYLSSCGITNISVLETYNLQDLQYLSLNGNNIGIEGCITISNLLQQEGSTLTHLFLSTTGMGDEEAELLATSLKHNTTLESLYLKRNNITEKGYKAFLKLLVDASSIESTYNSNYTLINLNLPDALVTDSLLQIHVEDAVRINKNSSTSHAAGRAKVISYQLFSQNRNDLCRVQGIEHCSIGNLFADTEPTLLPRILALIGEQHGQSEFYSALISMAPDLLTYIDRKAMIKDEIEKNTAQIVALARQQAALSAKNDQLSRRLAEEESDRRQSSTIEEGIGETATKIGKKRQRTEDKE